MIRVILSLFILSVIVQIECQSPLAVIYKGPCREVVKEGLKACKEAKNDAEKKAVIEKGIKCLQFSQNAPEWLKKSMKDCVAKSDCTKDKFSECFIDATTTEQQNELMELGKKHGKEAVEYCAKSLECFKK